MSKSVEFYFDFGSPTAYLAWTQLPAICAQHGATLVYRPVLLGGVFQATGNASPVEVPAKGAYMLVDLQRFARRYGVTLNHNPFFLINTLVLMRCTIAIQQHMPERFDDFVHTVFTAMWIDKQNLGDPQVVAQVLEAGGYDAQALFALSNDPATKEQLKAVTAAAVARGVFGVPSVFVGDEMFFGQDRLDFVREALQRS